MTDRFTIRAVTLGLIGGVLGGLVIAGVLTAMGHPIPGLVDDVVKISLGALAALLARTGTDVPQPVQVVNEADEAVPVEEAPPPRRRRTDTP